MHISRQEIWECDLGWGCVWWKGKSATLPYEREAWNRWDANVKIKLYLTYITVADEEAIKMTRMWHWRSLCDGIKSLTSSSVLLEHGDSIPRHCYWWLLVGNSWSVCRTLFLVGAAAWVFNALSSRNTVVQRCITLTETRTSHWGLKKSIRVLGGTESSPGQEDILSFRLR